MSKHEISKIIDSDNKDRKWISVKEKLPKPDQKVYIRFQNKQFIYEETKDTIYYSEDLKLAKCVRDYNDPDNIEKCSWVIEPPYLKYNFSPLSQRDKLLEGSVVTHWSESTEDEQDAWNSQDKPFGTYTKLVFEVDDQNEEAVYVALYHATSALGSYIVSIQNKYQKEMNIAAMAGNPARVQELKAEMDKIVNENIMYHELLYDLQKCIDHSIKIEDGVVVKLHDLGDPENEDGINDELDSVINNAATEKTVNALTEFTLSIKPVLRKLMAANLFNETEIMNTSIRNLFIGLGLKDPMNSDDKKEE